MRFILLLALIALCFQNGVSAAVQPHAVTWQTPNPGDRVRVRNKIERFKWMITEAFNTSRDDPPAQMDRQHWLDARNNLSAIIQGNFPNPRLNQAIRESAAYLKDQKMWPMPFGVSPSNWIRQVQANIELPLTAKIELLQNEAFYQDQILDLRNGALIRAEIRRLGGLGDFSLDVRRTHKLYRQYYKLLNKMVQLSEPGATAFAPKNPTAERSTKDAVLANLYQQVIGISWDLVPGIVPIIQGHPQYSQMSEKFRSLGDSYEIAGLLWSGVPNLKMNQWQAKAFCAGLGDGSRLPTEAEYQALLETTRVKTEEPWYELNDPLSAPIFERFILLPDMIEKDFWSSSSHFHLFQAKAKILKQGLEHAPFMYHAKRQVLAWVRCVH